MPKNNKWFYRGREVRGRGKPRHSPNVRLSQANKQQFYAGWDEEERLRQPPPTEAEKSEAESVRQKLRQFAADFRAGKRPENKEP